MFPFLTHVGSAQIQYFHPENCHLFTQNSFSVSPKGAKHKVARVSQKMSMILIYLVGGFNTSEKYESQLG